MPVDARLAEREVVQHRRALARDIERHVVDGVQPLLLVLKVRAVGAALQRGAERRDELVDALAAPVADREDRHRLVAAQLQLRRERRPRAVLRVGVLLERRTSESLGRGLDRAQ